MAPGPLVNNEAFQTASSRHPSDKEQNEPCTDGQEHGGGDHDQGTERPQVVVLAQSCVNTMLRVSPSHVGRDKDAEHGEHEEAQVYEEGQNQRPDDEGRKVTGLRLSARGWLPAANGFRTAGYLTASYTDYPGQDLDRLTADFGALRDLTGSGRTRVKAGLEFGTYGGELLYRFPYVGLDSVLRETKQYRIAGELKAGRIQFPDFRYLDATYLSAAASARKPWSQNTVVSLSTMLERSQAKERPYSYTGWNLGPAIDAFWPETTFLAGARLSLGARRYAAADPLFGKRRSDSKLRLDVSVGNKRWRWRDRYVSLVASVERGHSNIEYYSYRKFNVSLVLE